MTTKHTPEPWETTAHSKSTDFEPRHCTVTAPHADGRKIHKLIAIVYYGETDAEREANARLITAAPELLAALELCSSLIGPAGHPAAVDSTAWAKARAAIAKATGGQP